MARNNWEKLVEKDDIPGLGVPPSPGQGWRSFAGLIAVGSATFVLAYYVPMHRAYTHLFREYQSLSTEATELHQRLGDAVAALNQTAKLSASACELSQTPGTSPEALLARAERIERGLLLALRKFQGSGGVPIERSTEKIRIRLTAPEFLEQAGSNLTDLGKKAVCAIGSELKDSDVRIVVRGLGVLPTENRRTTWLIATARAGGVAQHLSTSCDVDAVPMEVAVHAARESVDSGAVVLEISPKP